MSYQWHWGVFLEPSPDGDGTYLDLLLSGLGWTVATSLAAWLLALAAGIAVGILRTLPGRGIAWAAGAWVEFFRNVPLLVQMFLGYFVVPELLPPTLGDALKQSPDAAFYTAVFCLGTFTSARVAEHVRAGIEALPRGQRQAAQALGLTTAQSYRCVILPQALRIVLPSLTNEFLNVVKNSAVALTIGLMELTAQARAMQEFTFQVFEAFSAATLIYLGLNLAVTLAMRAVERRLALPGAVAVDAGGNGGRS